MNQKKLQAKDFITIGIFTAILWVVQMIIMYMGFLSPFIVAGYAYMAFMAVRFLVLSDSSRIFDSWKNPKTATAIKKAITTNNSITVKPFRLFID